MAALKEFYLPSADSPGNFWRIGYYKPDRAPGVVSAYEGELRRDTGWQSFTCDLFGCRKYRHQLTGRATKRAVAQALSELLVHMEASEVISHEIAMKWVQKAQSI
jgi:hypothetical protein